MQFCTPSNWSQQNAMKQNTPEFEFGLFPVAFRELSMFNLVALSALRKVCVYLPDRHAGKSLEHIFKGEELEATSVATSTEFREAMQRKLFTAVVTVSSCIDEIRAVCDLPIIDVQALYDNWCDTRLAPKASAFETLTFLQGTCFVATRR
jgi:hypothetical protein